MDRIGKTSIFKCILLLSAALSFLVLTGCGSGLPWKINEHSNTTVYTGDDVKLSITDKSLTNAGCTYLLKNDRDSTIYSSEIFCLQIWFDNKWNGKLVSGQYVSFAGETNSREYGILGNHLWRTAGRQVQITGTF